MCVLGKHSTCFGCLFSSSISHYIIPFYHFGGVFHSLQQNPLVEEEDMSSQAGDCHLVGDTCLPGLGTLIAPVQGSKTAQPGQCWGEIREILFKDRVRLQQAAWLAGDPPPSISTSKLLWRHKGCSTQ